MAGHATAAGNSNTAEWDYIIVGAGSAGCVLANRLTQDGHFRVLLIEGGGEDYSPYIRVPAGLAKIDEKYNWRYTADPDPSRNGLVEHWGAGKVIGGSSSINGQVWTRGNAADYDEWAKLGADGWDGASVLPYFKRAERFEGGADQYRGDRGRQSVEYVRVRAADRRLRGGGPAGGLSLQRRLQRRPPARRRLHAALPAPRLAGQRRPGVPGARPPPPEPPAGQAGAGHPDPHRGRPGRRRRVPPGRRTHTARARREVLLSAGALASPKLLMLSGVGPEDELRPHRIDVRVASPGVGLNLQEHIWATVMCTVNIPSLNMETTPKAVARHGLNFVVRGRGAVATPAAHAILFGQFARDEDPGGDRPDYEMAFAPFGMSGDVVNSIDAPAWLSGAGVPP